MTDEELMAIVAAVAAAATTGIKGNARGRPDIGPPSRV